MIRILYKFVGFIFLSFLIFIFIINYNYLSFKESFFIKVYYAIKINLIYYIFYIIYIIGYITLMRHHNI